MPVVVAVLVAVVDTRSALASTSARNAKTDDLTESEDTLPSKSTTSFGLQSLLLSTACWAVVVGAVEATAPVAVMTFVIIAGMGRSSDGDCAVFVAVAFVVVVVATGMGAAGQRTGARTLKDDATEGAAVLLLLSKFLYMLVGPDGDASQGSLSPDAIRSRSAFSAAAVVSRAWIFFSRTICFASSLELHPAILALSAVRVMLEWYKALVIFFHSPSTRAYWPGGCPHVHKKKSRTEKGGGGVKFGMRSTVHTFI